MSIYINDLPPEIIAIFLRYTSYYISRLVCNYWKEIIGNRKNGIMGISNIELYEYFKNDALYNSNNIMTEVMLENNRDLMYKLLSLNCRIDNKIYLSNYFKRKQCGGFTIVSHHDIKHHSCVSDVIDTIIISGPSQYSLTFLLKDYRRTEALDWAILSENVENIIMCDQYYWITDIKCFINFIKHCNIAMFNVLKDISDPTMYWKISNCSEWFYKKCIKYNFPECIRYLTLDFHLYPSSEVLAKIFKTDNYELLTKIITAVEFISDDLNNAMIHNAIKCVDFLLNSGIEPDEGFVSYVIAVNIEDRNTYIEKMLEKYGYVDVGCTIAYYIQRGDIKHLGNYHGTKCKLSTRDLHIIDDKILIYCIENNIIQLSDNFINCISPRQLELMSTINDH